MLNLAQIRGLTDKFNYELGKEHYLHFSGQKKTFDSVKIFNRYKKLPALQNIKTVQKAIGKEKNPWEKRRLLYLRAFLTDIYMGDVLKKIEEKHANEEAKATVTIKGKKVPFRHLSKLLIQEPSQEERKKIFLASNPIKKRLQKYEKIEIERSHQLAKEFGFYNYIRMYEELKGVDYNALADKLRKLLRDSDALYKKSLAAVLKKSGLSIGRTYHFDFGFVNRAKEFDKFFPKIKMVPVLKNTLKDLGFDLNKQKSIILDLEERPNKVPRAFCSPLIPGKEIYLVMKAFGGQQDYETLFHEAGHAEHYANVAKNLPYEFLYLGDHSVSETYAFVLEHLKNDALWLQKHLKMDELEAKEFHKLSILFRAYFVRRYCAKLLYELKLHSGDYTKIDNKFNDTSARYKSADEAYADILTRATKVKFPRISYLSDVDSGFYTADYLRAWILEAQIRSYMLRKFGSRWFENRSAGKFLKKIWSYADKYKVDELAKFVGYKNGLDVGPLTKELMDGLR